MAAAAPQISSIISSLSNLCIHHSHSKSALFSKPLISSNFENHFIFLSLTSGHKRQRGNSGAFRCSAANKPSSSNEISSAAKIRSEVLSPFRSVRMFFYIAFIASAGLGTLITLPKLIFALSNESRSLELPEILKNLGIDIGAVLLFAFLYIRENTSKNAQISRLSREERLSGLKLRVDENRIIPISSLRGFARLVILAGPALFIQECFKSSKTFADGLLERGIRVVPFVTDGGKLEFEFVDGDEEADFVDKKRRLWQLNPVFTSEWESWINEQKKLANVSPDSPVYLSLRMDGRVRGSGVGYPPWNAFVAQLPPVKGIWSGLLDGMDGRV